MPLKASQNELRFAMAVEGCRLAAYQDGGGVWTIGVGHTKGVKKGDKINNAQAMQYLADDMAVAEAAVLATIKNPLEQHQFDMLVDITFNAGPKFINDPELQGAIASGHKAAVAGLMVLWALDNGAIQDGLLKRRAMCRSRIFQQGYTNNNLAWIDKHKI